MRLAWPAAASAAVLLLGCGLISSDITRLTFDLPAKTYRFDTASANLPADGSFPEVPCGDGQAVTDCCAPPAPLPAPDCAAMPLSCDAGACTLHQPVTVSQKMDLGMEAPSLRSVSGQTLADVFLSRIRYTVASSLNVELPAVTLYLAPDGVTSPSDPQAKKFGTVPPAAAGETKSGDVALESDSQQTFAGFARNFRTPFNFIASTTVVVRSGSAIPTGAVDISVTGSVSVQPAGL